MAVRSVAVLCGAAGVALAALAGPALADEFTYTFNLAGTSDYVFRGFSQSARDPAIQGGADFAYNIFYAGVWASSIDFGTNVGTDPAVGGGGNIADAEVDLYGGIAPIWKDSPFGDVTFKLGFIYYYYPGSRPAPLFDLTNGNIDYLEGVAGYSVAWKQIKGLTTGTTLYYSGDYTYNTGRVWTLESTASYTLSAWGPVTPSISGTWGYNKGESGNVYYATVYGNGRDNYQYWNAGVTFAVDKISLDLRYWDTNVKDDNAGAGLNGLGINNFCTAKIFQCDENFVATVKVALP
jgi:uncharacterized protein (TIGR02001 family)